MAVLTTALLGIQAASALAGLFQKRPRAPQLPADFGQLDPESERRILDAIERRVGRSTTGGLERVKSLAAKRGFVRSGLLPKLETDVISAGQSDLSEAFAQFELGKVNRKFQADRFRATRNLNIYNEQLGDYSGGQQAAAGSLGNLSTLLMLLQGRETGGWSSGILSPGTDIQNGTKGTRNAIGGF